MARNFIILNIMTENKIIYHDLQSKSKRKDGNRKILLSFSVIVFNMMKFLVKTLMIELFS